MQNRWQKRIKSDASGAKRTRRPEHQDEPELIQLNGKRRKGERKR
jgi:hypothetical protein